MLLKLGIIDAAQNKLPQNWPDLAHDLWATPGSVGPKPRPGLAYQTELCLCAVVTKTQLSNIL